MIPLCPHPVFMYMAWGRCQSEANFIHASVKSSPEMWRGGEGKRGKEQRYWEREQGKVELGPGRRQYWWSGLFKMIILINRWILYRLGRRYERLGAPMLWKFAPRFNWTVHGLSLQQTQAEKQNILMHLNVHLATSKSTYIDQNVKVRTFLNIIINNTINCS